jgi:hypothetical protein
LRLAARSTVRDASGSYFGRICSATAWPMTWAFCRRAASIAACSAGR